METEAAIETEAGPAFFLAVCDGDTVTVRKILSTEGAQSLINYQDSFGATPLLAAAANGHEVVTKQLIEARCNIDLHEARFGFTPFCIAPKMGMRLSQNSYLKLAVTSTFRCSLGTQCSASRPKMDIRLSRRCSLKLDVTSTIRTKMGTLRSAPRPKMDMLVSQSTSLKLVVTSTFSR
jgi:hypothetical protein